MSYLAANGQEITDEMINTWCDSYEKGEFPEGEHTIGEVVMGRPPLSSDKTVSLNVKIPLGMKLILMKRAEEHNTTTSAYIRTVLTNDILSTR